MAGRIVKILRAGAAALALGAVAAAVFVGLQFLTTELPEPRENVDPPVSLPDYAPRRATIPWKRDIGETGGLQAARPWLPWEKPPMAMKPASVVLPLPAGFANQRADAETLKQIA